MRDKADRLSTHGARAKGALAAALFAVAALLSLAFPALAAAGFEQVANFAKRTATAEPTAEQLQPEQLYEADGLAVNYTGAGGVEAGTVYGVSQLLKRVSRYGPEGEFREAWGWGVAWTGEGSPEGVASTSSAAKEFQRCGPDGEAAHPVCNIGVGTRGQGLGSFGVGGFSQPRGIAVDQSTGYVYTFDQGNNQLGGGAAIQVFTAAGEPVTQFGEYAVSTPISESPDKLHGVYGPKDMIAVDGDGVVYVADQKVEIGHSEERVMRFKPQTPGDYEHYVYAGVDSDIATDQGTTHYFPSYPELDEAGNLYLNGGEEAIYQFAPGEPDTPSCTFEERGHGIEGMTVNPESGEVFFFKEKDKKIHRLTPCAGGEFEATETIAVAPASTEIFALALNPLLKYGGARPRGALYAAEPHQKEGFYGQGHIFAQPPLSPPSVVAETVAEVTSSSATLRARINPNGYATRYLFQYLSRVAWEANESGERFAGAAEAPVGGALLSGGLAVLGGSTPLSGLAPDTVYHYRVIASSHCDPEHPEDLCEDVGADRSLRTYPAGAPGLAEGRAYELVSPFDKHGGEVIPPHVYASCGDECKPFTFGHNYPMQSAPDGEAVVYEGFPFSLTEGAPRYDEYLARRGAGGWRTTTLSPPLSDEGYEAFDAALGRAVLLQGSQALTPAAPPGYSNLYTQPTAAPATLTPLIGAPAPNRNPALTYAGASADLSHVAFAANDALTPATPFAPAAPDPGGEADDLYESVGGALRLVNVLPGNAAAGPGAVFGSGTALSAEEVNKHRSDFSHAVSADGSRIFWSAESGHGRLYVREDGEVTREIPDHEGRFLTASADGSKVLLSDGFLYDLETETLTDLTAGQGGFLGILGQSDDLSSVYFVDKAALAPGAEAGTCSGAGNTEEHEGKVPPGLGCNLYAWHEGAIALVATLQARDNDTALARPSGSAGDWFASPPLRSAQASADGRWLAFDSRAQLTGFDNVVSACGGGEELRACTEVYLYDAAGGALRCASCAPSGEAPLGWTSVSLRDGPSPAFPQPGYLTDSGRLYFDTQNSLSAFDTNGGVEDVYQFEPEGTGECARPEGCVTLISAGRGGVDSNFLGADANGRNVFFVSRDRLTLKDRDDLFDLYDAREGGGFVSETEIARGECQGEACQAPPAPPEDATPASASFAGAGNVREAAQGKKKKKKSCPRGSARRHNRCVKRHRKHRRHKMRHRAKRRARAGADRGGRR
jgi:hypothetical protein